MTDDELIRYADASLALHGFALSAETREAVIANLRLSASIARQFLDIPLGPEDEQAPVFTPGRAS